MKKIFHTIFIYLCLALIGLMSSSTSLAAAVIQSSTQPQQYDALQKKEDGVSGTTANPGFEIKNQVQTKNTGEGQQLKINTQETTQNMAESSPGVGTATTRQNISAVAEKVEELLSEQGAQGGIGQQVKAIATQQKQAQVQIKSELDKLQSKKGLARTLFGPDREALTSLKKQMEQNQQRIQRLEQLKNEVVNESEQTHIQELKQALVKQNTALSEQVQQEESKRGIFGWLRGLLTS